MFLKDPSGCGVMREVGWWGRLLEEWQPLKRASQIPGLRCHGRVLGVQ